MSGAVQRIPLSVSGGPGVRYASWPVTQGIPFGKGVLARGTPVRVVDQRGKAFPTQSACLASWDKDYRWVRWLLIDAQIDWEEDADCRYFLEYGEGAEPPQAERAVQITREANLLQVDTGALRMKIRSTFNVWEKHSAPAAFASCEVRDEAASATGAPAAWSELFPGHPGPFLYMTDARGEWYDSVSAGFAPRVTVEEAGPVRACLRIDGYHSSRGGVRFCPYVLRLHLHAGSADVRLFHTFIFDQEPHDVALASIGVRFPLAAGEGLRAAVGGQTHAHWARNFERLAALQRDDRTLEVTRDGAAFGDGLRSSGWAALCGSRGGLAAVVRDHWKEYPKGSEVTPSGLDVQIWPEDAGELLRFTTPFEEPPVFFNRTRDEATFARLLAEQPTAPLNLKSLDVSTESDLVWVEKMLAKHGAGRTATHNDTGTSNGVGAAKTTEIALRFSAVPIADAEAEGFARAVQEPLLATAEPAYACATGAFGHFYHAGDPRFARHDAVLDGLVESVAIEPRRRCRLYGMMRWGNMVCSHSAGPTVSYVRHLHSDPENALRHVGPYNNEANDQIMATWGYFLHSGRREHFLLAQSYSRNVADVGIVHAHPGDPGAVGLMHYHNCHQWSGGPSPSHTLTAGILTDYYLTGNRRLLDVATEVADWAVRHREPAGIVSCRHGTLHRELTGPLWCLLEAYRATWDEKYGEPARRTLNWFLRALPEDGTYPRSVYTRGERGDEAFVEPPQSPLGGARDMYHLFMVARECLDSAVLRRRIVREADLIVHDELADNYVTAETARRRLGPRSRLWAVDNGFYWTDWGVSGNWLAPIVSMAYDLTGDLRYAAWCRYHLDEHLLRLGERVARYADWRFTWLCFGSYVPRLMRTVAQAEARDPAGLDRAEQDWERDRAARGMALYRGPGVDFAKDSMDPNGGITTRPPDQVPRELPPEGPMTAVSIGRLGTEDHAP